MANNCDIEKNNIDIINANDEAKREAAELIKLTNINEDLVADLHNDYDDGEVISQDIIDDYIEKRYGAKSETMKAASVIYAVMNSVSLGHERIYN